MTAVEREEQIHDAIAIVQCLQSLLCEAKNDVTLEANGLYVLLGCILKRLNAAQG